ncbi:MAG: TetR/AcrR family transcriptional regulator [Hyphomicrobiaceae bacterium]|nr:MAG: TetR/AcrR family transcriptional regulator [Hyphomicrobiaceae bacterium]
MKTDVRAKILQAALALFAEVGFAKARSGDICARAGISNGSLFHFFPTKEAIAVALYVEAVASYQADLVAALEAGRTPAAALRAVVAAQCTWVTREERRARFLFAQGTPDWHAGVAAEVASLNAQFRRSIESWRGGKAARARLRPMPFEAFAAILLGPSLMAIRAWLRSGGPAPTGQARVFADAAVRSLLKE